MEGKSVLFEESVMTTKIKCLGTGSAFSQTMNQTSFLINDYILVDFGMTGPKSLKEAGVSYDQIHPLVIGKLIMNFGFKQLNYTATWNCFGWASVTMDSWENYKDDTNKRILKELPDELKNKINELGRLKAELDSKEIREWTNTH